MCMRRVLICCVILIVWFTGGYAGDGKYAMSRGSVMISGRGGFNSQFGDRDPMNPLRKFYFSPSVMYFLNDNFAAGIEGVTEKLDYENVSATAISVGPALGIFMGAADADVKPYAGCGFHYYHGKVEDYSELKLNGYEIVLGLGGMRMVSDDVGISGQFMYAHQAINSKRRIYYPELNEYTTVEHDETGNVFSLAVGLNFFIF